ncbi:hypothetical protein SSX86_002163 [Deinandra increscens subsp. villosa]|uniref:X8 domain-containing protein n=1 Tax=Deinandra increscens subsp. villosa TaxID=3103831 RepID=A0AAP0HAS8_9ASTR
MSDLGIFLSKSLNVMIKTFFSRKLSSELDYSVPSDATVSPLPPLVGVTSPPTTPLPFPPAMQPPANSAHPPYGFNLPPCNPYPNPHHRRGGGGSVAAPPPVSDGGATAEPPFGYEQLWCVAKPSVPSEKLQEAMDYACGVGGADCAPISPTGSCYFPDNIVAHASYAFNSYWQKNKRTGGTCGFGGTAMLISSDPREFIVLLQLDSSSSTILQSSQLRRQPQVQILRLGQGPMSSFSVLEVGFLHKPKSRQVVVHLGAFPRFQCRFAIGVITGSFSCRHANHLEVERPWFLVLC